MSSPTDLILKTFQYLFGYWPLMFLAVGVGMMRSHFNWSRAKQRVLADGFIVWSFLAVIRATLLLSDRTPNTRFLKEPLSSLLFFAVGLTIAVILGSALWRKRRKVYGRLLGAQTINDLLDLTRTEFEALVAEIYHAFGHRVEYVGAQGDQDVDLEIHTPNNEKWIVQCKRTLEQVDDTAIRDLYLLMHDKNAHRGTLITTSTFSPQAHQWAEGRPIYLYDGEGFLRIMKRARDNRGWIRTPAPVSPDNGSQQIQSLALANALTEVAGRRTDTSPPCPNCDAPMIRRTGISGLPAGENIFVCSNFPECQVILSLK